jgi:hypothetical protein
VGPDGQNDWQNDCTPEQRLAAVVAKAVLLQRGLNGAAELGDIAALWSALRWDERGRPSLDQLTCPLLETSELGQEVLDELAAVLGLPFLSCGWRPWVKDYLLGQGWDNPRGNKKAWEEVSRCMHPANMLPEPSEVAAEASADLLRLAPKINPAARRLSQPAATGSVAGVEVAAENTESILDHLKPHVNEWFRQRSPVVVEQRSPVRPATPTRDYCLLPPNVVHWEGETTLEGRLWHLLGVILDACGKPVPFAEVEEVVHQGVPVGSKTISNDVGRLNSALRKIGWPHTYSTKSSFVITA